MLLIRTNVCLQILMNLTKYKNKSVENDKENAHEQVLLAT